MIDMPSDTPQCCGTKAEWIVHSPSLQYWYCRTCKTEPKFNTIPSIPPHQKDLYPQGTQGGTIIVNGNMQWVSPNTNPAFQHPNTNNKPKSYFIHDFDVNTDVCNNCGMTLQYFYSTGAPATCNPLQQTAPTPHPTPVTKPPDFVVLHGKGTAAHKTFYWTRHPIKDAMMCTGCGVEVDGPTFRTHTIIDC